MKIAIIGKPGSGKSTLAFRLQKKTGLPLYHLDAYFWKPGWQEPERLEFQKIHHQLCDRKEWIIEGVASRLFDYRAEKADVIIFLDAPTSICLYRVFRRAWKSLGVSRACGAKDCPERFPSFKFLKYILSFDKLQKPVIERLLAKNRGAKRIFVVKSQKELDLLIKYFSH